MNLKFENTNQVVQEQIQSSNLISRDLSWMLFNYRVLEQVKVSKRSIFDRLKFLAITASNLDEFLMIRVGSLYNYLDYNKARVDYSGLREEPFKETLFDEIRAFSKERDVYFSETLKPLFEKNGFQIVDAHELEPSEERKVAYYFNKTVYPMLTPMVYDSFHAFPVLQGKMLIIGVVTKPSNPAEEDKYSFVQIPQNLPKFFELKRGEETLFIPIESIVLKYINKLFKKVTVDASMIFRITRNGDFDYDTYDESENTFVEEIQRKLKNRKTGRVVRLEVQKGASKRITKLLRKQFGIEKVNVFQSELLDFTRLWQIVKHKTLNQSTSSNAPVSPLFTGKADINEDTIFNYLKKDDLILHHPYNSIEPVLQLLEAAAEDADVLAIKITIYRLADDSRVTAALLRAAERGKHVSVLFEVKARFDEENNIREGQRLQKAGCFVIYGVPKVKTHTKLLMIVRRSGNDVCRFVHMSSGNYNESTAGLYTDISYMTSERVYGKDISEFFNVITGHSIPNYYKKLITTPGDMRKKLIRLIRTEVRNAQKEKKAGIIIKVNSLEDKLIIEELYKASQAGVPIKLIVRGICCCRPGRKGLSENITIKSIVGEYLEHSRIYYFHNDGEPKVYGGSADVMVRSFDKRIESLYLVEGSAMKTMMAILDYSLRDEKNSFYLQESGNYVPAESSNSGKPFDIHQAFYKLSEQEVNEVELF